MSATPASGGTDAIPRPAIILLTVLVPFGCGFYLSYLARTVNAVISPHLISEFGLDSGDLGLLTGIFFITFAALQLPLGVMLDRFGPRRVQSVLLALGAAGSGLFAVGESFAVLCVARGLIGAGFAGGLMASIKANTIWWPKDRLPLMNNAIVAFGSFGALSATVPVQWFLGVADWRDLFGVMAVIILAVAVATWTVVPERAGSLDRSARLGSQFAAFGHILGSGAFWRAAILLMVLQGSFLSYQTLWAGPWLRDVGGFDEAGTGFRLLIIQAAMFAGVIFFGVAADLFRNTRITPRKLVIGGTLLFIFSCALLGLRLVEHSAALWALMGIAGPASFLCFTLVTAPFPETQVGRVITAGNLLIFAFAFAAQWGIGVVIDLFPGDAASGHGAAFAIMIGIQVVALLVFLLPVRTGASSA